MFRVETRELNGALICKLEGRFTGAGAEQVRMFVTRCDTKLKLVVDVTEVMFIDATGEEVLSLMKRLGARFVADTSYSRDICERLQLALVCNQCQNSELSGNRGRNGHRSPKNARCTHRLELA